MLLPASESSFAATRSGVDPAQHSCVLTKRHTRRPHLYVPPALALAGDYGPFIETMYLPVHEHHWAGPDSSRGGQRSGGTMIYNDVFEGPSIVVQIQDPRKLRESRLRKRDRSPADVVPGMEGDPLRNKLRRDLPDHTEEELARFLSAAEEGRRVAFLSANWGLQHGFAKPLGKVFVDDPDMVAALLEFLEKMPQQYVSGVQLPGGNVMVGDGEEMALALDQRGGACRTVVAAERFRLLQIGEATCILPTAHPPVVAGDPVGEKFQTNFARTGSVFRWDAAEAERVAQITLGDSLLSQVGELSGPELALLQTEVRRVIQVHDHGRASAFPEGTAARAAWEDDAAERKLLADGFELLLTRTGAAAAVRRAGLAEVHETIEKILTETVFQLRARRDWQHHAQRWEQQPVKKSKNKRKKVAAKAAGEEPASSKSTSKNSVVQEDERPLRERVVAVARSLGRKVVKARHAGKIVREACKPGGVIDKIAGHLTQRGSHTVLHGGGQKSVTLVRPHGGSSSGVRLTQFLRISSAGEDRPFCEEQVDRSCGVTSAD